MHRCLCLALCAQLAAAALLRQRPAAFAVEGATASRSLRQGWPEECAMEGTRRLQLARGEADAATEEEDAEGPHRGERSPVMAGDVFVGTLGHCEKGKNTGVRLEVESWPSAAKLSYFPLAHWNNHDKIFDKPTHSASAEYNVAGSILDGYKTQVRPVGPQGAGAGPRFGLAFVAFREALQGQVLWTGNEGQSPAPDAYPFYCTDFEAKKCKGLPPQPTEKVVVFMRHGATGCESGTTDPTLNGAGLDQVKERLFDPNLVRVLSSDPGQQAEVVLMSPLARAMHTALLMFGQRLPQASFELDPDLVELGGLGILNKDSGGELLRRLNATKLMRQYEAMGELAAQQRVQKVESRHQHHEHSAHVHGHHHHQHQYGEEEAVNLASVEEGLEDPWLQAVQSALVAEEATEARRAAAAAGEEESLDGPELEERFQRFTQRLMQRPEKRFIAVSHRHLLKAGTGVSLDQTNTLIMALSSNGTWRQTSQPPHCWPSNA